MATTRVVIDLDDGLYAASSAAATAKGSSLPQLVIELLEQWMSEAESDRWLADLDRLNAEAHGDSKGERWTREDLHAR